jgi:receptor protein-tyrosine kinase
MSPKENVISFEPPHALVRADRPIGAILAEQGKLTPTEVQRVLDSAAQLGVRFGEAAVRLGLVTEEEVRFALARQFDFPHLVHEPEERGARPSTELVAAFAPFHPRTEEMRALRTQLLIRWYNPQAKRNALVIASPGAAEGRSYVAANLAVVFAQLGARTLLLDADLRNPRQHAIFGVPPGSGLSTLLAGRMDHGSTYPVPGLSRLSLLPAGPLPPNPQELISRPAFTTLLKDLQALYDVVIIDTPPAEAYADAQSVAYRAGDAMVIARKDRTKVSATSKVVRELAGTGARVVGTVINTF